MNNTHLNRLQI